MHQPQKYVSPHRAYPVGYPNESVTQDQVIQRQDLSPNEGLGHR